MSEHVTVRQLSHATQQAQEWINDLTEHREFEDAEQAYAHLRAVLHALRDRLTPEEVAHLGSQLPMMVRGFYFEGWRPALAPNDFETAEQFYQRVQESLGGAPLPANASPLAETSRAVLEFLVEHVDPGQMRHVREQLPQQIAELLPPIAEA